MLMYYGHVLATLPPAEAGHGPALQEMRFIYSFHMPLFFLMAGFFFRPSCTPAARIRELALRRLIPVLAFSLLLLPLWSIGPLRHGEPMWQELGPMFEGYLRGLPRLNWVTWFLVCLWVCECIALFALPRLHGTAARLACGLASIFVGVSLCNHLDAASRLLGVQSHTWFIYEAIVAFGFYAIGNALYPFLQMLSNRRGLAAAIGAMCLVVAAFASPLNAADFEDIVMMSAERQGVPTLFAFSALCGSMGVIALAMLARRLSVLQAIGRHSMALLGFSGLFFHFINPKLVAWWPPSDTPFALSLYVSIVSIASIAVAMPFAVWLMRHAPVLVGNKARLPPPLDVAMQG